MRAVINGNAGEWSPVRGFTTGDEMPEPESGAILEQNYPNPFNPTTEIRFTLAESQKVFLKVYDLTGRFVTSRSDGILDSGSHTLTFRAENLSSGVYFYRFITGSDIITRQMMLMK